ncbi:MAG TPA: hypothetical protein PK915_09995 [Bacteroidales bacterium]|nr:hypothetical protein [Bacteroidales bacterium]
MALFKLGRISENDQYISIAVRMAIAMKENIEKYPASFSNWALLWMFISKPFYEIVICGNKAQDFAFKISKLLYPGKIALWNNATGTLPVFNNRFKAGQTLIYICSKKVCHKPVASVEEATELL